MKPMAPLTTGDRTPRPPGPWTERDACGVGFIADIQGRPTHRTVQQALQAVSRLGHRGAIAADRKTGDGAGVLTQLPREFFTAHVQGFGERAVDPADIAVAMVFLDNRSPHGARRFRTLAEEICGDRGIRVVGWRKVPVDTAVLGAGAYASRPDIQQALLVRGPDIPTADEYERRLYLARRELAGRAAREALETNYVVSMSSRTIVYKGLVVGAELGHFYPDLSDPRFASALAVFHQRYSTNTHPTWQLAQPFRMLAHNGEINTLDGNRNWLAARAAELTSDRWGRDLSTLLPVTDDCGSDSYSLDHTLEFLVAGGRSIIHAGMMLVPEAWEHMDEMPQALRNFYNYHTCLTEPWDGPAALAYSDGRWVCAALDRNGLRPSRYVISDDGTICVASEVGVLDIDAARVVEKGRLGPGQIIAVDTERGLLLHDADAKQSIAAKAPYGDWLAEHLVELAPITTAPDASDGNGAAAVLSNGTLTQSQHAYGFTREDVTHILEPMARDGLDPVFSMGNDAPLAVLSGIGPSVFGYVKQRFAQVTNPPIDPLRESLVMSLDVRMGPRASLLSEVPEAAHLIHLRSPVIWPRDLAAIESLTDPAFRTARVDATFPAAEGPGALAGALDRACRDAVAAVEQGAHLLILTDEAVSPDRAAIPILLAVGAVHHALIAAGRRMRADIIVASGQVWDVHHFCALLGYGASAICPWLALQSAQALASANGHAAQSCEDNFVATAEAGIRKVMSKMGISTLSSYHGAQIFEAVGLAPELVERCLPGTPSTIGGVGAFQLAEDVLARHAAAFAQTADRLPDTGWVRYRKNGEFHAANPTLVKTLQRAVQTDDPADFEAFDRAVDNREPYAIRDLLRFRAAGPPVPLDEVESAESLLPRFCTTAMSIGALSPEAHSTISKGMNRIGARSNTGEGGEDATWYKPDASGDWPDSRIKQVASARFGVTPEYLVMAEQLEIKMAQGSKPGEGGQIPARKVTDYIASLRFTVPGIPLISPPPHHDIYSIEDLSQLIYDLKEVNPRAAVGVKLVAESGVGTIAAGVAKAYADYVLISGHDGGTGASPLSSIKNAGVPWEIGLSETQRILVRNGLRDRIRVRTDGGLKSPRDVVIAALLGAEEFGFGTMATIAVGCIMARQCHLNTCPVGVATQREDLRARFTGEPVYIERYFLHLAHGVRAILARLGARQLDDIVGRVELLEPDPDKRVARAATMHLGSILARADETGRSPRIRQVASNDRPNEQSLDVRLIEAVRPALDNGEPVRGHYQLTNDRRAVGTRLSGEIAHGVSPAGLPPGTIHLDFTGTAGQSFGAFGIHGLRLRLVGEANDYVAKGLGGAVVSVQPPAEARFTAADNVIAGNTCLYGATAGELYLAGRAGERFAVRNSGATAVVEGIGDHGCEYMTSGVVVILGPVGRNFAAGMSAGQAFAYDPAGRFPSRVNHELVTLSRVADGASADLLRDVITRHVAATQSRLGQSLLDRWDQALPDFWQVVPYPPQVDTSTETQIDAERAAKRAAARERTARRAVAASNRG